MKKSTLFVFATLMFISSALAQNTIENKKLYDPAADAKSDIAKVVEIANKEGKHVFLQLGGNWCGWCKLFDKKVTTNDTLKITMEKSYVVYHVNYSKENINKEVFASLGYPQRFGFPVFVILDGKGNRLHTQNSEYLEEGKGHSIKKIFDFLNQWSPDAIDPKHYEN